MGWRDTAIPVDHWRDTAIPVDEEQGLLPVNEARAKYRQEWADSFARYRSDAERMGIMPHYQKKLEKYGGESKALDYFSSDYFFGMTPLGRKYKEAGLLGEVKK